MADNHTQRVEKHIEHGDNTYGPILAARAQRRARARRERGSPASALTDTHIFGFVQKKLFGCFFQDIEMRTVRRERMVRVSASRAAAAAAAGGGGEKWRQINQPPLSHRHGDRDFRLPAQPSVAGLRLLCAQVVLTVWLSKHCTCPTEFRPEVRSLRKRESRVWFACGAEEMSQHSFL